MLEQWIFVKHKVDKQKMKGGMKHMVFWVGKNREMIYGR